MGNIASSLLEGGVTGAASGALAAFGAYSAASALATASRNCDQCIKWCGCFQRHVGVLRGGSLAAGGRHGRWCRCTWRLVAGPALLVMGVIIGAKGGKNLEEAKTQSAEASKYCEQMMAGADQCVAIRRRSYMFHALLARLDAKFCLQFLKWKIS